MNMRYFGSCEAGDVQLITLKSPAGGMEAEILTLGATLRALRVPDKNAALRDVVLGYDSAEAYFRGGAYFGATVGRFANRIAGAAFELDGKTYRLSANEGVNQLHGGPDGFHRRIWTPIILNEAEAVFRLSSPDGDMGFPGNLSVEVLYSLAVPGELRLEYKAVSDRKTVVSLTNHSYFNLNGHASGEVGDHFLSAAALSYTPTGAGLIPTGEILPVEGTAMDLRMGRTLADVFDDPRLAATRGYDHNFMLEPGVKEAACLTSPESGLSLHVITDCPAMQIYTAGFTGEQAGKDGAVYQDHNAVCLETQIGPDAMHHDNFPSPVLEAGREYHSETIYCFKGGVAPKRQRKGKIIRL
ncbi:MAG: galactose mutarotase [Lachnospiraceae bacterium]|nr:galactose mutarotase [Lachnospiraceae bacterium]